ncbi:MFS transporter [Plantactinospora endophytica]|uniref:MFS transporter n=1 Tax=Plantactinospora endophytica TaxID=673535 RepID=A0ABQ4EE52_9ACTN|nr:MFS transporter [Plantactinospora endophytica]GIG93007.1 MFS transporter [Plantactinospora endophytica]
MITEPVNTPAACPAPIRERRRPLALGVLSGALALDIGSLNVVNAALPGIGTHFGLEDATLQWTMTAYAVTFAGFLLFGGRLADVLGRRFVFTAGISLFTVAALGGALAPSATVLVVARALQGIGAALCGPAALALLTEIFSKGTARNRAFGVYAAVGAASGSGGFVLGGALTQLFGWRSVFMFSVVSGVAVLAAAKAALPAGVRRRQPLDLPGAATVTAGLLLAVFGISHGAQAGWNWADTMLPLAAAVVLLAAFVLWELRAPQPLLPIAIFRAAPVRASTLAAFLLTTAAIGLQFFAPLYLQGMLGYSPLQSGLAVLPLSLTVFVTATFCTGRLLSRVGQRPLLVAGLVLIAMGVATWAWTSASGDYWLRMLPGLVVMGIGIGVVFPTMTAAALTGVPQHQHGVAGAVNVTAQQIGAGVGVTALVVVAAVDTAGTGAALLPGYHAAYLTAGVACGLGALVIGLARGWNGGATTPQPEEAPAATRDALR